MEKQVYNKKIFQIINIMEWKILKTEKIKI